VVVPKNKIKNKTQSLQNREAVQPKITIGITYGKMKKNKAQSLQNREAVQPK